MPSPPVSGRAERAAVTDAPIGELVRSVAMAVVEAQSALDDNAIRMAERMSGREVLRDPDGRPSLDENNDPITVPSTVFFGSQVVGGKRQPVELSMLELGFTPTFYQFAETTVELRLALRITRKDESSGQTRYDVFGAPVDATYQSHYGYDIEGSCVVKTRLVPVPSPPLLEERVRLLLEEERRQLALDTSSHSTER